MATIEVKLRKDRETPGTFLFKELDADGNVIKTMHDAKIGNLYVRKSAFKGVFPNEITVTVTYDT